MTGTYDLIVIGIGSAGGTSNTKHQLSSLLKHISSEENNIPCFINQP